MLIVVACFLLFVICFYLFICFCLFGRFLVWVFSLLCFCLFYSCWVFLMTDVQIICSEHHGVNNDINGTTN